MGELYINWPATILSGTVFNECVTNTQTDAVQTLPNLTQQLRFRTSGASRILRKLDLSVRAVNCICRHNGCHMKSELQHTGT
jgi:hypothetical protein